MDTDTPTRTGTSIVEFEQALEDLILTSFAAGVPVEGTWEFPVPVADAPDWIVTIEKTYSAETGPYQPHLLEE